jgi:hypothetical protein
MTTHTESVDAAQMPESGPIRANASLDSTPFGADAAPRVAMLRAASLPMQRSP